MLTGGFPEVRESGEMSAVPAATQIQRQCCSGRLVLKDMAMAIVIWTA